MTPSHGFNPAAALDLPDQARPKLTRVPLRHPPRIAEASTSREASIPARLRLARGERQRGAAHSVGAVRRGSVDHRRHGRGWRRSVLRAEFAATALGERLAVAYRTGTAAKPSAVVVQVQEPWGSVVAKTTFESQSSGQLAVAGSPGGDSLVVAVGGGSGGAAINVLRFDCAP